MGGSIALLCMAVTAVRAANAIGALISACVGRKESTGGTRAAAVPRPPTDRQLKRKRGPSGPGPGRRAKAAARPQLAGALPPGKSARATPAGAAPASAVQAAQPPPEIGDWWSASSDEAAAGGSQGGAAPPSSEAHALTTPPPSPSPVPSPPPFDLPHGEGPADGSPGGASASAAATPAPFVNHALAQWHRSRRNWTGARSRSRRPGRAPVLGPDATYEELLATSRPFPQPVPLPEMVDFLVDVWDQEGLYD